MVFPEAREEVRVPDGVTVTLQERAVKVKGPKGELSLAQVHPRVALAKQQGAVLVTCAMARRREKALVGTVAAHLRNMVQGVQEPWEYRLKVVYSHFPIKVKVQGAELLVDNFIGEKSPRRAAILPGVEVKVDGDQVVVRGIDLGNAGQTAANIEQACRIRDRDPRVFQDGVYIVTKPE